MKLFHNWETIKGWGVVVGLSRCKDCQILCRQEDFGFQEVDEYINCQDRAGIIRYHAERLTDYLKGGDDDS